MFASIFSWIVNNWTAIAGVATGAAGLVHSFQTRAQLQAHTVDKTAHS